VINPIIHDTAWKLAPRERLHDRIKSLSGTFTLRTGSIVYPVWFIPDRDLYVFTPYKRTKRPWTMEQNLPWAIVSDFATEHPWGRSGTVLDHIRKNVPTTHKKWFQTYASACFAQLPRHGAERSVANLKIIDSHVPPQATDSSIWKSTLTGFIFCDLNIVL
jgi:hypothetical protein